MKQDEGLKKIVATDYFFFDICEKFEMLKFVNHYLIINYLFYGV